MRSLNEINAELASERGHHERLRSEYLEIDGKYGHDEVIPEGVNQRLENLSTAAVRHGNAVIALEAERHACLAERAERVNAMRPGGAGVTTATGDGAAGAGAARAAHFGVQRTVDVEGSLRSARDAGGVETLEGGRFLRDAAMSRISDWSQRSDVPSLYQESAERAIVSGDRYARGVAEYIAECSTLEYEKAFRSLLLGGAASLHGEESLEMRRVEGYLASRAMSEGSVGAGAAAVPPMLDPSLILTNAGAASSFAQACTTKVITTQTWKGVTSAGVSASWTAEAAEWTDASPSLGQPTITPYKLESYVQISWELLEDTELAQDMAELFGDATDRLTATAFAAGTGSTQPFGIATQLDNTTASRLAATTSGSIGLVDIYNLDSALAPRWRPGASWMANKAWMNRIRQVAIPSLTNFSPYVDVGQGMPANLIGYPIREASGLSASTASNTDALIFGDFAKGYFIVNRLPSMVATLPVVVGANRRPTGESGYAMYARVGGDCVVPSAFQMLRI